jgi:hypothetical protein
MWPWGPTEIPGMSNPPGAAAQRTRSFMGKSTRSVLQYERHVHADEQTQEGHETQSEN